MGDENHSAGSGAELSDADPDLQKVGIVSFITTSESLPLTL